MSSCTRDDALFAYAQRTTADGYREHQKSCWWFFLLRQNSSECLILRYVTAVSYCFSYGVNLWISFPARSIRVRYTFSLNIDCDAVDLISPGIRPKRERGGFRIRGGVLIVSGVFFFHFFFSLAKRSNAQRVNYSVRPLPCRG